MRSGIMLGLVLLAAVLAVVPARAEDAPRDASQQDPSKQEPSQNASKVCEVPASLLRTESALPKVADVVKSGRPLDVLIVGSRSSTILGSEASAYPARLQASLREKLAQATVNVSVEMQPKKTAGEIASSLVTPKS